MKLFAVIARDPREPCVSHCLNPGLFRFAIQVQMGNIRSIGCNQRSIEDTGAAMARGAGTKDMARN